MKSGTVVLPPVPLFVLQNIAFLRKGTGTTKKLKTISIFVFLLVWVIGGEVYGKEVVPVPVCQVRDKNHGAVAQGRLFVAIRAC